jgi:hypothetical protein
MPVFGVYPLFYIMDIDNNVIIFMCLGLRHGKLDESKTVFPMNNQYLRELDSL